MSEAPRCPECGNFIGMMRWEPPYNVWLKQARQIGDLTTCLGGADFLSSSRFIDAARNNTINGLERTFPVRVVKVGSRGSPAGPDFPELFGVDVVHSRTRVDYRASKVQWHGNPSPNSCRVCGPGGGGRGGVLRSISDVSIETGTWDGSDIFFPINLSGTLFLSEHGHQFFEKHAFTNCKVISCTEWSLTFGDR